MTTKRGYARRHLGGGNILKAVTRARRSAASNQIGKTFPLKHAPRWRTQERRALERIETAMESAE